MLNKKDQNIFKSFLKDNKILVVDPSGTSRARLKKSLIEMGAISANVFITASYDDAFEYIEKEKPQLVFSDFKIKNGSGFDLFRNYKIEYPEEKNIICILITSDGTQSLVARAAEEDVDSFLLKPYNAKSLEANLQSTIVTKVNPSDYLIKINEGKDLLFDRKYKEAYSVFQEAISLNPRPSLANFYAGQAKYLVELTDEAQEHYKKGLKINRIHFKCQIGLYKTLVEQGKKHEAYEVVKSISKIFPANPERLSEVIRLCIFTENYHDMIEYYNLFISLEVRPEKLKKHVLAGTFIAGKYHLIQKNRDSACFFFNKIAVSCGEDVKMFNSMLDLLIEYNCIDGAKEILSRYPIGLKSSQFEVYDYIVNYKKFSSYEKIKKAEHIIQNIVKNKTVFSLLLKELALDPNKADLFKSYKASSQELWPNESIKVA